MKNENMNNSDPENYWKDAEKMLDTHFKKKRRTAFAVVLSISALIVTGAWLFNHSAKNESITNKITEQNNSTIQKDIAPENNTSVTTFDNKEKSSSVTKHETASETPVLKETTQTEFASANKTSRHENISIRKEKTNTSSSSLVTETKTNSLPHSPALPFSPSSSMKEENSSTKEITSFSPELSDIALLNPISFSMVPSPDDLMNINWSETNKKRKSKMTYSVSLYASTQYVSKIIKSGGDDEYIQRRKKEETGVITNSFGGLVTGHLKRFSLSAGIEYSCYGEKTNYSPYRKQNKYVDNGDWQTYLKNVLDSDTAYIMGNVWIYQHTVQQMDSLFLSDIDTVHENVYDQKVAAANGTNKFYFIEIPLEVSYHLATFGRMGIGATVGVSPAWLVRQKGYYLKKDESGVEQLSSIKSYNSFIVNGHVGIDFYYMLSERINLALRPQLKTNFNSVFTKEYNVDQRYYSTGLNVGVVYSFK